ncbi:MAG: carbon-nitrogen hydrolase [Desulfuromonadales bacterium GWD2_61_12]|nr:MAG: carbon-nitrogen hydrolase [Desulfuromonadales bacterium GWC2_61_20]OGR32762.1 MAG: carbon-nitrogen hydrolase [Desulfuromonadales bacterium GWD2_61_12]HAD05510.1 carbon-nitrogen family hydrolase [Desulfuromonas sp.]
MSRTVHAAAVQFNIRLGEVEVNLATALAGLRQAAAAGARLAVLPEMWSSGYDYRRLGELAEATPRVLAALCRASSDLRLTIVGSLADKVGDQVFNCAYVVDGGKVVGSYRKLHLFSTMGEDRFLAAGDRTLVVDTAVGRLGVAICYDLRFPELFRKLALEGAEILCLPAEWPKPRQEHWRTLLRARAIENQLFVAAANCCGVQGKLDFFGMSLLLGARGDILAEGGEVDTCLNATFDFAEMEEYRAQIPCYRDRRPEIYGHLP